MSGIAFVHPAFLWGLAALAVPLLVHFLNRRQTRKLDFSTLRFFSAAAKRTSRMRRLRRLLLLLARMALICVCVAIFAKPYITRDPFSALRNPDSEIFTFVDPTVSMDYRDRGTPLWRTAFDLLDTLNKLLPPAARRFTYNEARAEFVQEKAFARPPGPFVRHGAAPLDKMFVALSDARGGRAGMSLLVMVSDFQDNISRILDTQLVRCGNMPALCVSVAPHSPWNCGVRDAAVSAGARSVVTVQVSCLGKSLDSAGVTVTAGGMRVGHAMVSAKAGESCRVPVAITSDVQDPRGTVLLDCDDPFPDDNTFYFVHGAQQALRVLVVGEPDESFPVSAAFSSLGASQWSPVVRPVRAVTYNDIDSAALVVLCGVRQLSPPLAALVHGPSPGRKAILFSPATDSASAGLAGALLPSGSRSALAIVSDPTSRAIVLPDTVSPLFKGFRRLKDADAAVNRYCTGLPGGTLMLLDNGKPFATHLIDTSGNSWVLLAAYIGRERENVAAALPLFTTGLYVPLLDRLARYALSAIQKEPQVWVAGVPRQNPYFGAARGALVFDAGNRNISRWSSQPQVAFDAPGLYRIQPDGEPYYWVAARIDSSETVFAYRAPHVPAAMASRVKFLRADRFGAFVAARRSGTFSPWLWIACALLLIAETLLWEKRQLPAQTA